MPRIEWDESFSVHHAEIDEQHKNWIDIYNRLADVLDEGDAEAQKRITVETLQAMLDYAKHHFQFEEAYMQAIGYPARGSHTRLHRECDALIYEAYVSIQEGNTVLNRDLLELIKEWLLNHILVEDKKYGQFVSEGAGRKP